MLDVAGVGAGAGARGCVGRRRMSGGMAAIVGIGRGRGEEIEMEEGVGVGVGVGGGAEALHGLEKVAKNEERELSSGIGRKRGTTVRFELVIDDDDDD